MHAEKPWIPSLASLVAKCPRVENDVKEDSGPMRPCGLDNHGLNSLLQQEA